MNEEYTNITLKREILKEALLTNEFDEMDDFQINEMFLENSYFIDELRSVLSIESTKEEIYEDLKEYLVDMSREDVELEFDNYGSYFYEELISYLIIKNRS